MPQLQPYDYYYHSTIHTIYTLLRKNPIIWIFIQPSLLILTKFVRNPNSLLASRIKMTAVSSMRTSAEPAYDPHDTLLAEHEEANTSQSSIGNGGRPHRFLPAKASNFVHQSPKLLLNILLLTEPCCRHFNRSRPCMTKMQCSMPRCERTSRQFARRQRADN